MWWQISLAVLLLGGAVAFIGDVFADRALAKQNAAIAGAQQERATAIGLWTDYAKREAEAADARLQAAEAAAGELLQQLKESRSRNVTPNAIAACTLSAGVVHQHNDAAAGRAGVPGAASAAVDAASGVGLDRYARAVDENYTTCHRNARRLEELQRWIASTCAEWNRRWGKTDRCPPVPAGADGQPEAAPEINRKGN